MELFDTHAHLDDDQFTEPAAVAARARAAGVTSILTVATSLASSRRCLQLAAEIPGVLAAVGVHPNYCHEAAPGDWAEIERLARTGAAVALGETGLDRHWDFCPFAVQQDYFDRHLRLAQATGLPVVIHMRDCADDVLAMLRDAQARGPWRGVMHSFTGDAALAAECLALGLYLSFSGIVTYKKSAELREVARSIPAERLLIETDSPYLSPHPERGRRPNEPELVVHTARLLAAERETPFDEFARRTTANARELFQPAGRG